MRNYQGRACESHNINKIGEFSNFKIKTSG
jgi:hypothetical protein